MGKSQELYNKAKKIIPGGTQLLSKRPEMFLPDLWPAIRAGRLFGRSLLLNLHSKTKSDIKLVHTIPCIVHSASVPNAVIFLANPLRLTYSDCMLGGKELR